MKYKILDAFLWTLALSILVVSVLVMTGILRPY